MDILSRFFVQQPLHALAVALLLLAAWAGLRFRRPRAVRRADVLLWPAGAWLAYGAWEWVVSVRSPEADIRVDLLLIGPLLALLTLGSLASLVRG